MNTHEPALAPTRRAREIAGSQGFGAHRTTFPVNRAVDRSFPVLTLPLSIAGVMMLGMAWQASPWSPGASSWIGVIASGITGVVFLLVAIMMLDLMLRRGFRRGARVHIFERGAIAERVNGPLYSWPFERGSARYVCWYETRNDAPHPRPQVWVTFVDGSQICFDGQHAEDRAGLPELARALGAPSGSPEQLGHLNSWQVPPPF